MIYMFCGNPGSGKTRKMMEEVDRLRKENFIDHFVIIDEGDKFLDNNHEFNLNQFTEPKGIDLFITTLIPEKLLKRVNPDKRNQIIKHDLVSPLLISKIN